MAPTSARPPGRLASTSIAMAIPGVRRRTDKQRYKGLSVGEPHIRRNVDVG
jgi:hypothetical protein